MNEPVSALHLECGMIRASHWNYSSLCQALFRCFTYFNSIVTKYWAMTTQHSMGCLMTFQSLLPRRLLFVCDSYFRHFPHRHILAIEEHRPFLHSQDSRVCDSGASLCRQEPWACSPAHTLRQAARAGAFSFSPLWWFLFLQQVRSVTASRSFQKLPVDKRLALHSYSAEYRLVVTVLIEASVSLSWSPALPGTALVCSLAWLLECLRTFFMDCTLETFYPIPVCKSGCSASQSTI